MLRDKVLVLNAWLNIRFASGCSLTLGWWGSSCLSGWWSLWWRVSCCSRWQRQPQQTQSWWWMIDLIDGWNGEKWGGEGWCEKRSLHLSKKKWKFSFVYTTGLQWKYNNFSIVFLWYKVCGHKLIVLYLNYCAELMCWIQYFILEKLSFLCVCASTTI